MAETMCEVIVVTDNQQEQFDLTTIPGENTKLVKLQQKKLSAELDLNRLITNLNNSSTLLYIAYNALSGTPVQSKVSGLQNDLSQLCGKSQIAMNEISLGAENVLKQLPLVYKMLTQGKAPTALAILSSCSACAGRMAEASEELATEFETMTTKTQGALESSQDLYASDLQKREEIQKQITEMIAKQKALAEKKKQLQETIQEVQEEYQEAQRKEEKAEKNALILGIVNIVSSSLSAGIGAVANTVKTQQTRQVNQEESQLASEQENLENARRDAEESEETVKRLKEELAAAERELETITSETPAEGEEAQAAYSARKTAAEQKVKNLKDKIAKAESSAKTKREAAVAAEATLKHLSEQLTKEREAAQSMVERAQATTSELFQLKLNMQKENREIASSMAEIAAMLQGQTEAKISADKAVEMLKLAIRCLGNVVVAFTEAALFWRTVEQGCNNLKNGAFIEQVQTFSQFDVALQSDLYSSDDFKALILEYMATWVALHCIGRDYYQVSVEAGKKVRKHIQTNLFGEDAFKEAARLSEEIINSMQEEVKVIDTNTEVIETMYGE